MCESIPALFRPADIRYSRGCAEKASRILNWRAESTLLDVVAKMIHAELERKAAGGDRQKGGLA